MIGARKHSLRSHLILLGVLFFIISCVDDEGGGKQSIKKEKISGFVQKGPFVRGTSMLMSELNSELAQTGKVFTSQISNDQGLFEINNIELTSTFVEFSSSGFYFNEVSGEISSAPITLTSFSDLTNKSSINVNVLTHLEKKRVENLIKSGKSFNEAKKQAKSEVLSIFSITLESNSDFEDFDISKNTEEGGILLAVSIILQGNRSVGELTELLSKIQNDIAADGKLDDATILNFLRTSTLDLDFAAIKKNVESRNKELNITTSVPDFEKHISKFLSFRNYLLEVDIIGEGTVEEKVVSNPSGKEYPYKTVVQLTPVSKEGWFFESWSGDLSGNNVPSVITVDKEKKVVARFERRNYPLNIIIEGEGMVNEEVVSNPSGKEYPFQTQVKLTSIPKDGWVFESWGGDLTGTDSTQTITLTGEKNVIARFNRKQYNFSITIIGNGKVEEKIYSSPSGRNYPSETIIELTAIADDGSLFDGWEGDLNGNDPQIKVTLDSDKNIIANFRTPIFRLAENGVTCICENVKPGDSGFINGVEYEAVDNSLLNKRRDEKIEKIRTENVDMSKLCTSLVTDMNDLFNAFGLYAELKNFNDPIGNWDVSNVTEMRGLFAGTQFNQSIKHWNVSNVVDMRAMFYLSNFNQNISKWCVINLKTEPESFSLNSPLTEENKPKWGTCPN